MPIVAGEPKVRYKGAEGMLIPMGLGYGDYGVLEEEAAGIC